MKKLLFLIFITSSLTSCSCQKAITEINQKLDSKTTKEIVLVRLINDSRCPENVQCIWAGEVTFEVAAYDNGNLMEQKQFILKPTNQDEVIAWLSKHLPKTKTPLQSIAVVPYPKDGVSVKLEEYTLKLNY
ncbi:MAG: hypothetical protein KBC56_02025 [Flavobacterium sp.]|nr:hypothetical protein [Flavobacterium sp.]